MDFTLGIELVALDRNFAFWFFNNQALLLQVVDYSLEGSFLIDLVFDAELMEVLSLAVQTIFYFKNIQ